MTDSILRSYQAYSYTSMVPFPVEVEIPSGANLLLSGETEGFAFDGTVEDGSVSVIDTGTPANNLSNVTFAASNLTNTGTSTKIVTWDDGTLHTIAAGEVAQDYDADDAKFGMLVEYSSTNQCFRSEDFTHAVWDTGGSITADQTTAPDGTATADLLTSVANAVNQTISGGTGGFVSTVSGYFKEGPATSAQWIVLQQRSAAGADRARAWFDIINGVKGTTAVVASANVYYSTMVDVGNGWYRCSLTGNIGASDGSWSVAVVASDGSGTVSAGKAYLWGAQWELDNLSSYMPTPASATVSRASDFISATTASTPWQNTPGTMYVDVKKLYELSVPIIPASVLGNTAPRYVEVNSSITNYIALMDLTSSVAEALLVNNAGTQVAVSAGAQVARVTRLQVSGAWNTGDLDASLDGATAVTGSNTIPTGITTFYFGNRSDAARPFHGYIYRFIYVPRQVETDAGNLETWRYNY